MRQQRRPQQQTEQRENPAQVEPEGPVAPLEEVAPLGYLGMVAVDDGCMEEWAQVADESEALVPTALVDTYAAELSLLVATTSAAYRSAHEGFTQALAGASLSSQVMETLEAVALVAAVSAPAGRIIRGLAEGSLLRAVASSAAGAAKGAAAGLPAALLEEAPAALEATPDAFADSLATAASRSAVQASELRNGMLQAGMTPDAITAHLACGLPEIPQLDEAQLAYELEVEMWSAWCATEGWKVVWGGHAGKSAVPRMENHLEVAGLRLHTDPIRARLEALGLEPDAFLEEHGAVARESAMEEAQAHTTRFETKAMP